MFENEEIEEILAKMQDSRVAINRLVATANENGGRDNITVIMVRNKI
jgi:serine/threonine protein phosphatase PrpC